MLKIWNVPKNQISNVGNKYIVIAFACAPNINFFFFSFHRYFNQVSDNLKNSIQYSLYYFLPDTICIESFDLFHSKFPHAFPFIRKYTTLSYSLFWWNLQRVTRKWTHFLFSHANVCSYVYIVIYYINEPLYRHAKDAIYTLHCIQPV